jgi:hypothetical protein
VLDVGLQRAVERGVDRLSAPLRGVARPAEPGLDPRGVGLLREDPVGEGIAQSGGGFANASGSATARRASSSEIIPAWAIRASTSPGAPSRRRDGRAIEPGSAPAAGRRASRLGEAQVQARLAEVTPARGGDADRVGAVRRAVEVLLEDRVLVDRALEAKRRSSRRACR